MKLDTEKDDPLHVLGSTKKVLEGAQFVSLKEENVAQFAELIRKRFQQGLDSEVGYSTTGNLDDDLQLVFIEDAVNFCFWAGKNEPKWQVTDKNGSLTTGGWFGLKACFDRGLLNGTRILDAQYISSISSGDGADFFRGTDGVQIPLLQERLNNLREAGKVLTEKFDGKFTNIVTSANYDAIEIIKLVIRHFPSFRDVSILEGREVFFYKRAQILAQDVNRVLRLATKELSHIDQLTAFADYKLPQLLRMFGVIEYNKELAERVDGYMQVPHDSREEIEIRAVTIWSVELLRQYTGTMSAADIDNTVWLMSQNVQSEAKPYHRTRTTFY